MEQTVDDIYHEDSKTINIKMDEGESPFSAHLYWFYTLWSWMAYWLVYWKFPKISWLQKLLYSFKCYPQSWDNT